MKIKISEVKLIWSVWSDVGSRYMWIADTCGWQIHVDGRYMWIADTCG